MPGESQDNVQRWVRREFSIGNVFMFLALLITGVTFNVRLEGRVNLNTSAINTNTEAIARSTHMDSRVGINTSAIGTNQNSINRVEAIQGKQYDEIKRMLVRIEDKLDKKVDK